MSGSIIKTFADEHLLAGSLGISFFPLWVSCAIYKSQLCVLRISNVRFLNRRCAFFSESQMSDLNRKPTKLVTPGPYFNINLAGKSFLFSTMADGSCKKALISHFESRISEALNADQTEESMAHFGYVLRTTDFPFPGIIRLLLSLDKSSLQGNKDYSLFIIIYHLLLSLVLEICLTRKRSIIVGFSSAIVIYLSTCYKQIERHWRQ